MEQDMKIVFNAKHGGFGLSDEAIRVYAQRKGIVLYPEPCRISGMLTTYWTAPPSERTGILSDEDWHRASIEERKQSNMAYDSVTLAPREIPRSDPDLIAIVEQLGSAANGPHAKLEIAEVEEGERYRIDEYDGYENVMTVDDYEWEVAS